MAKSLDVAMSVLDRLVVDIKGEPLGRVDDIEFTELEPGRPPRITALLCGPLALGPRLDHKWGDVWAAIGRRLRGTASDEPARIPWALVEDLAPGEVRLGITAAEAMTMALETWTEEHVIGLIPGSGD
jgi:hypothetical protein